MFFDRIKHARLFRPLLEEVRKQNATRAEILKALSFNSTVADSAWLKYKSFSPGLWAADFGLLYTLYRALGSMKPRSIAEFGLGQSSKMVHQYAGYFQADAVTYEHDAEWVKFFNEGRDGDYPVQVELLELETIRYKDCETVTYKGLEWKSRCSSCASSSTSCWSTVRSGATAIRVRRSWKSSRAISRRGSASLWTIQTGPASGKRRRK